MSFWSSQRLEGQLGSIVSLPAPNTVDCNAITLRIGGEIYITPGVDNPAPSSHTKKTLASAEAFTIPPGQFAFLVTEETITIPKDAMGFISFKARYKMMGLVNVSGFHVDPGYSGQLTFSVFNAGPAPVHLQQGLQLFLLWLADLDAPSVDHKTKPGLDGISMDVINSITGKVPSIFEMEKRIDDDIKKLADEDKSLSNRIHEMEKKQNNISIWLGIVVTALIGVLGGVATAYIKDLILPHDKPAAASTSINDRALPSTSATTPAAANLGLPADMKSPKEVKAPAALTGNKSPHAGAVDTGT